MVFRLLRLPNALRGRQLTRRVMVGTDLFLGLIHPHVVHEVAGRKI